jgi:hypothetical protein
VVSQTQDYGYGTWERAQFWSAETALPAGTTKMTFATERLYVVRRPTIMNVSGGKAHPKRSRFNAPLPEPVLKHKAPSLDESSLQTGFQDGDLTPVSHPVITRVRG